MLHNLGWIDERTRDAKIAAARVDPDAYWRPLDPDLAWLFSAWATLGPPVSILAGMAAGVVHHLAELYQARRGWLDEEGVTDRDERRLCLALFSALDAAAGARSAEQLKRMQKG